jgi:hypothetical protein
VADGWLAVFSGDDKATFIAEMRDALAEAERSGDLLAVETCIRGWQMTAEALADPEAREVLTAPFLADDDFTEVGRPGA